MRGRPDERLPAPVSRFGTIALVTGASRRQATAALPHLLAAAEKEPRLVADVVNVSSVAGRVARVGSGVDNASKWPRRVALNEVLVRPTEQAD